MARLLKFRKMVWVFILLLVFTGIFTYYQLPKREIPEINVNIASISTVYPGATPTEVESSVTNPLENELLSIEGVDELSSASTTGFSNITITLADGTDLTTANSKIRQVVSDISRGFPEEVQDPDVNTDVMKSAVASYHLMADNYDTLYQLRETVDEWKDQLEDINGVDSLLIKGLPEQEVVLSLDNEQLKENRLSAFQVIESINNELTPSAIGTEQSDNKIYQLVFEKYKGIEELGNVPVGNDESGDPLFLSDIGDISIEEKQPEDLITYEGTPAISITIMSEEGANISSLQETLTEKVDALASDLPSSVSVDRFYTQSTVINEVFTNLITSFAISLVAVFAIMLLGLPFSAAVLVGISIPISILIGLTPLPYTGVDLNQISIIGMIIAIGILVDDAIVVNDNIQRRYQMGDDALTGAIKGVKEVGKSIITSTLMIVFSFFPLTFLSGSNGDFIRALPTVLIFTIIASTIIALTLIPTVRYAGKLRSKKKTKEKAGLLGGFFNWLETVYADKILPKTTKRPWVTGLSGLVACILLALLVVKIPFEFFPSADRPEVTVSVRYPQGTPIEETKMKLEEMEQFLTDQTDHITETAVYTGSGLPNLFSSSMQRTGENTGQLLVRVDRSNTSASAFIDEWESTLRDEFDGEIFLDTIVSGPPPSPPVEVKIQGPQIEELVDAAQDAASAFEELDSTEVTTLNAGEGQSFIRFEPDRQQLAENGIPVDQVTSQIQVANTGIPLGTFDNGVDRLPMKAIVDDGAEEGVDLGELEVVSQSSPQQQGGAPSTLSLDEIISEDEYEEIGAIPHLNGVRTITLQAYPVKGEEDAFNESADQLIDDIETSLPEGYQLVQTGESNAQTEFFIEVSKLFVIVLFLIYLTIAVQFNSLTMPLLVTSSVFLAITGAIIGLFVTGQPLSFLAVLGIVSLSGIVVRNSVILIEFIEQNKEKTTLIEAVIEAGRARIRPIVLTTLTSVAALVPIIFSGDVLFQPLAVSIVSGLLFSTILTLMLVPAFYLMLHRIRFGRRKENRHSTDME
ncbi:efflux RND transporter permease subunit [Thalassobacillus hwangdonensis]|uniref:Efflux RND transporter permease subunit n=1 Tax=Thalassobacillus hwangdonensis TaxID=546108 RepID=A0ABW3KZU6_9BACI